MQNSTTYDPFFGSSSCAANSNLAGSNFFNIICFLNNFYLSYHFSLLKLHENKNTILKLYMYIQITDMLHVNISLKENCTLMSLEVNKFIASTK